MLPSTPQVLGFFNLVVGLMLVMSILLFLGGFVMYLVRLGTWPTYRDETLKIMEWGVSVLFTLIVLLAIQQFLATHLLFTVSLVALVIVGFILWVVISGLGESTPPPRANGNRPPPAQ